MKYFKILLALGAFALAQSPAVSAATFNFVDYADSDSDSDGHHEWGYPTSGFVVTEDSITLTATGKYGQGEAYAYLDDLSGGREAGLGVCQKLDGGNQCSPSSDDNVTKGETLILNFGQTVNLETLNLSNGNHYSKKDSFNGTFGLTIDGVDKGNKTLSSLVTLNLTGQILS